MRRCDLRSRSILCRILRSESRWTEDILMHFHHPFVPNMLLGTSASLLVTKGLTSSNKKLVETSALLVVTSALKYVCTNNMFPGSSSLAIKANRSLGTRRQGADLDAENIFHCLDAQDVLFG